MFWDNVAGVYDIFADFINRKANRQLCAVLHDNMKPQMYGDMAAFVRKLRDMGFSEVRDVDTAASIFGSKRRAAMMMLGDSAMICGKK